MSVVDVIVLLAFIAVAVLGAEVVRLTCRRQLSSIPVNPLSTVPANSPGAPAEVTVGAIEAD